MKKYFENLAKALLGKPYSQLEINEQVVIQHIADGEAIAENVNIEFQAQLTFGQKLADKVSVFVDSWTFIVIFMIILMSWMVVNSLYLAYPNELLIHTPISC